MAREAGTKTVAFSPAEIEEYGLGEDVAAEVKARLATPVAEPVPAPQVRLTDLLPSDVREFVKARAAGLGFGEADIVAQVLRQQMQAIFAPAPAPRKDREAA